MASEGKIPTIETGIKIKLTVKDRLSFQQLYPKQSNLITQLLVRDVDGKVSLTQEEQKAIHLRAEGAGLVRWDDGVDNKFSKNVMFTEAEVNMLKDQVSKLDKEEKIHQDILDLCLKIKEAKKEQN